MNIKPSIIHLLISSIVGWVAIVFFLLIPSGFSTPISSVYIATLYSVLCIPGLVSVWVVSSMRKGLSWHATVALALFVNLSVSAIFSISLLTPRTKSVEALFKSGFVTTAAVTLVLVLLLVAVVHILHRHRS